jgi:hypothetical protein
MARKEQTSKTVNLRVKSSALNELDEVLGNPNVATQYRVRFYAKPGDKAEGIPVTEMWVDNATSTCRIRNYGLTSIEALDTITRAAAFIKASNLTINPEF